MPSNQNKVFVLHHKQSRTSDRFGFTKYSKDKKIRAKVDSRIWSGWRLRVMGSCLLLKQLNYVTTDFTLDALSAFGLRPNTFKDQNQTKLILLLERFHIWRSRSKQTIQTITSFSSFLEHYKKVAKPLSLRKDN